MAELHSRNQRSLSDTYTIERELGGGGMPDLQRSVAEARKGVDRLNRTRR